MFVMNINDCDLLNCGCIIKMRNKLKLAKLFFILIMFVLLNGLIQAEGISVSQSLEESSISFESNTTFEIKLQWDGPQWTYRFDRPLSPTFDRLKVKGFTSSISSHGSGTDEISVKTYKYTLIPTSSGKGIIDPINIPYVMLPDSIPGELVTEAMTVQVHDSVPVEETDWTNIVLIVTVIAIVFVVLIIVFLIRLKKKGAGEEAKSPKEKAIENLNTLKNDAGNDMKKFQTGLYQLLRDYVNVQYSIDVEILDDDELTKSIMECGLSKSDGDKLAGWIIKAKQDKFRPIVSFPGETIRLETEVREFISKI